MSEFHLGTWNQSFLCDWVYQGAVPQQEFLALEENEKEGTIGGKLKNKAI